MENKIPYTTRFLQRRKFFTVLPLLITPFLTMAFWAMGGGSTSNRSKEGQNTGLNLELPGAHLKDDKHVTKLSFYEQAEKEGTKNNAFWPSNFSDTATFLRDTSSITNYSHKPFSYDPSPYSLQGYKDPAEEKVYQKLEQLNKELNRSTTTENKTLTPSTSNTSNLSINSADLDRLESMAGLMNGGSEGDPEMKELNTLMDKIMDIQHPERVKERIKKTSTTHKEHAFVVQVPNERVAISLLGSFDKRDTNSPITKSSIGFYSLEDKSPVNEPISNAIEAVVHETATLVNGATIKLRLLSDVYVNGILIPKNSFCYGTGSLREERLHINIKTIREGSSILSVALAVYDLDGMEGIYVPGSITREVAKNSADQTLQNIEISTLDPSLKAQAAGAAIGTVKSLMSRKTKQVKVTVKAGYKVFLKNERELAD